MRSLRMTRGNSLGREFALVRNVTVIGKEPDCDIVLPDPHVSKRHAQIDCTPEGDYIQDLDSTNKTKVGGRAIKRRRLRDGDFIKICGYEFRYIGDGETTGITPTILSEIETSTASQARPEEKLRAIMDVVTELTGVLELGSVLEKVLDVVFRIFPQAERGFVLFKEAGDRKIRTGAVELRQTGAPDSTISRTIYEYVTGEARAILCEDVAADGRFRDIRSLRDSQVRTMMCVPLGGREGQAVGALQIDTREQTARFGRDDLDFLVAVAGTVGMAVENARLHEVAVRHEQTEQEARDARAVQRALLPQRTPDLPGYEFWHDYEPARLVGGDYFDYRPLAARGRGQPSALARCRRWAIALADVSGKGMPAALLNTFGLITRLEQGGVEDGGGSPMAGADEGRYRLTHDFLAAPLMKWLARGAASDHKTRASTSGRPIDINSAAEDELKRLPGIGPVLARRVIERRPYQTVDDLLRVKGMSSSRLSEIRPLVTLGGTESVSVPPGTTSQGASA